MVTNIAIAVGALISAGVIFWNIRSLRLQKMSAQASLFHDISSDINSIIDEQKEAERKDREDKTKENVENWYERLFFKLEYFCFFANRKFLSKDMIEYYVPTIITYCKSIKDYPRACKELQSRKGKEFGEIKRYYEKYCNKKLPF